MDHDQQLRNLRDFLLVYNRMTEICFQRCTSNMNYRNLTMDEERCVDNCAGKLIRSNHRLMGTYVQLMPRLVQRRMDEMESKAAEATKAGAAEPGAGEALALAASGPKEAEPGTAGPGTAVLTVTEMAPHSLLPAESLSLQPQPVPHSAPSSGNLPTPAFEPSVKTASRPAAPS